MSEMVERLAKIISRGGDSSEVAVAVLKEMRTPTQKMMLGGVTLEPTRNAEIIKFIYQGMIDAAMKT